MNEQQYPVYAEKVIQIPITAGPNSTNQIGVLHLNEVSASMLTELANTNHDIRVISEGTIENNKFTLKSVCIMGFHKPRDIGDYSITELLDYIDGRVAILERKIKDKNNA